MRSESRAFKLVSAIIACYVLASATNAPLHLPSAVTSPHQIHSTVAVVAPPITAEGYLYDRTTGAILYDAVTLRPIYA